MLGLTLMAVGGYSGMNANCPWFEFGDPTVDDGDGAEAVERVEEESRSSPSSAYKPGDVLPRYINVFGSGCAGPCSKDGFAMNSSCGLREKPKPPGLMLMSIGGDIYPARGVESGKSMKSCS